jgi:hypothetical protein
MDLTKVNGCYSKELREMAPTIILMAKEESISLDTMKNTVHKIVEFATINAAAKKRFISNLFKCKSKDELNKLCHEAVIHGMYYRPKKKATV